MVSSAVSLIHSLQVYATQVGIDLTSEIAEQLLRHLDLVLNENKIHNLTRITDVEDALVLHIVDSLLFSTCISSPSTRLLDIGSGGGYPGIPIALHTMCDVTLVDSVQKKTDFLSRTIEALGITSHVRAVHARIEDYATMASNYFNCVTARAVASLETLIEYAAPLLTVDGILVVSQGPQQLNEDRRIATTLDLCGMEYVSRETYTLPHEYGTRRLVKIKKSGEPKVKLPRRAGLAIKRPLYKYN